MKENVACFFIKDLSKLEEKLLTLPEPITFDQCEMIHIEPSKSIFGEFHVRINYIKSN